MVFEVLGSKVARPPSSLASKGALPYLCSMMILISRRWLNSCTILMKWSTATTRGKTYEFPQRKIFFSSVVPMW